MPIACYVSVILICYPETWLLLLVIIFVNIFVILFVILFSVFLTQQYNEGLNKKRKKSYGMKRNADIQGVSEIKKIFDLGVDYASKG